MQRRKFLQSGLAASALALAGQAAHGATESASPKNGPRDYFELRAYRLKPGRRLHCSHSTWNTRYCLPYPREA